MTIENKIFYNEASANKLGWDPSWFNHDDFDNQLIENIEKFQKAHDLEVDGMCGPTTFRRVYTEREALIELASDQFSNVPAEQENYIICNGVKALCEWDKVVNIHHPDALLLEPGRVIERTRNVRQFVVHWDAALSAKSCRDILKRRGLSVQFAIDNDGTIYQYCDANHVCWHAPPVNWVSIGVEISNAVELKYQKHYERKGFGKRPVVKCPKINGKYYGKILAFYPEQIEALKALVKSVQSYYVGIDSKTPEIVGLHKPSQKELVEYSGIVHHYHVDANKKKWDAGCLDLHDIVASL